jgi:hypothetical protein
MKQQRPDLLGQGIILNVTMKVKRFRLAHAWLLVALAVALMVAVACLDWCVPRWAVYFLTVLLVLDALLHAAINRAYAEGEIQAWKQVLGLADTVMHQARVDADIKTTPPKPTKKSLFGPPPLRVVRPDNELPERSK